MKRIENEKIEVKELVKKLLTMDRNSEEFTHLVLYGLLPYHKRQFAERVSTFPAFMNIKSFFKEYNYSDEDWNKIANMIFSLVEKFQKDPSNLKQWIEEFTNETKHSRKLQCGSITPILFCLNDSFPLVNNKIINTYKIFANKLGWDDRISQKLDDYMENIPKCQKLMNCLGMKEKDFLRFDLFCYQYDQDEDETSKNVFKISNLKPQESVPETFTHIESWDFIQQRIHKLPPSDMESIGSIIDNILDGKYAIPIFQREYTWTNKQVEELWESIFQGFFIGSILTWGYNEEIKTISIQDAPSLRDPTDIILDGQQRITSLFYSIVDPDLKSIDNKRILYFVNLKKLLDKYANTEDIVFFESYDNAKKHGYLSQETQFTKKIFPITQFHKKRYASWLEEFKKYLKKTENTEQNADEYYEHILKILDHVWFKYGIPVVKLPKSLSLANVAEIFEKINSKGTRLGVFDLLNARFTKYDIKLRDLWNKAKLEYPEIQDMDKTFADAAKYTLQGLCLFKRGSTRRKELLTLDEAYQQSKLFQKEEFLRDWSTICKHVSNTIKKLRDRSEDGFGAVKLSMTPYTVIVPILTALMYNIENRNDAPKCMKKIEMWYWSAVTSDNYSGSTDTKTEKDHRELLKWFANDEEIPEIVSKQREEIDSLEINTNKTTESIYKAVMCLVCKSGAKDFRTDRTPEYSTLDDHHIFAKDLASQYQNSISINSILNRTVLDSTTNRKFLRNKKPSEYIKEIMQTQGIDESEMRKRLKTHLISDDAFDCLLNDDFDGFVNAREDTITGTLHKLIMPQVPDDPRITLLYSSESQDLEYKSSLIWDYKRETINRDLESVVCKELCAFMNSEGGNLLIGVDDQGKPIGLEKDYVTLKNYDGFIQHLTNLINRDLGKTSNVNVKFESMQVNGVEICICRIMKSKSPVFLDKNRENKFFIRANNTCQSLDPKETHEYIAKHWGTNA